MQMKKILNSNLARSQYYYTKGIRMDQIEKPNEGIISLPEIEAINDMEAIEAMPELPEALSMMEELTTEQAPNDLIAKIEENFALEVDYFDQDKQEDKLWQARTGLTTETLCGAIETVIFMSDRPLPLTKIRTLIDPDMPLRVLHDSLKTLMSRYEEKLHGIRLQEVAEGYQFRTKATYSKYVQDLFKVNALVLSPSTLEVLSIIAYKQPVSRVEVDNIRGVDSSHIVRTLMDKRLVKIIGRSEELGRPITYGTTQEFLEVFNLSSLESLPPESELQERLSVNEVGEISDIKNLVRTGDKTTFSFDEIDELDQLTESIKAIASETSFTSALKNDQQVEGEERKSAFDLLEEYLTKQQVEAENLEASQSQPAVYGEEPKVISDLNAGPFNVPTEDDFEMLDLETGNIIDQAEVPEEDLLFKAEDRERLEAALDQAFGEFEVRSAIPQDDLGDEEGELTELEENIDFTQDKAFSLARDLDLDLSFLEGQDDQGITNSEDVDKDL
jgi:segregation and condensation protein B